MASMSENVKDIALTNALYEHETSLNGRQEQLVIKAVAGTKGNKGAADTWTKIKKYAHNPDFTPPQAPTREQLDISGAYADELIIIVGELLYTTSAVSNPTGTGNTQPPAPTGTNSQPRKTKKSRAKAQVPPQNPVSYRAVRLVGMKVNQDRGNFFAITTHNDKPWTIEALPSEAGGWIAWYKEWTDYPKTQPTQKKQRDTAWAENVKEFRRQFKSEHTFADVVKASNTPPDVDESARASHLHNFLLMNAAHFAATKDRRALYAMDNSVRHELGEVSTKGTSANQDCDMREDAIRLVELFITSKQLMCDQELEEVTKACQFLWPKNAKKITQDRITGIHRSIQQGALAEEPALLANAFKVFIIFCCFKANESSQPPQPGSDAWDRIIQEAYRWACEDSTTDATEVIPAIDIDNPITPLAHYIDATTMELQDHREDIQLQLNVQREEYGGMFLAVKQSEGKKMKDRCYDILASTTDADEAKAAAQDLGYLFMAESQMQQYNILKMIDGTIRRHQHILDQIKAGKITDFSEDAIEDEEDGVEDDGQESGGEKEEKDTVSTS